MDETYRKPVLGKAFYAEPQLTLTRVGNHWCFNVWNIPVFKAVKGEHWLESYIYIWNVSPPFSTDDSKITWTEKEAFWPFWKCFGHSSLLQKFHFRIPNRRSQLLPLLSTTRWSSISSACGFWFVLYCLALCWNYFLPSDSQHKASIRPAAPKQDAAKKKMFTKLKTEDLID